MLLFGLAAVKQAVGSQFVDQTWPPPGQGGNGFHRRVSKYRMPGAGQFHMVPDVTRYFFFAQGLYLVTHHNPVKQRPVVAQGQPVEQMRET